MAPSPATDRGTCRTGGFSWVQHTLPQEPSSLCPRKVLAPCRPPLTCICEMASSILKRVCRMQEQDDCETVTHCRSHRISSHMHDTCGTPKGPQHQPHWLQLVHSIVSWGHTFAFLSEPGLEWARARTTSQQGCNFLCHRHPRCLHSLWMLHVMPTQIPLFI